MKYTEEQIIKTLQTARDTEEREQAAAILMEQYTGLLWSVCQRRLSDSEDIKECVNSTFAQVCLHPEHYDVNKGSLKNYLCMVADRKAIDCYHRNARRLQAEENYSKEQDQHEKATAGSAFDNSDRFLTGNERTAEKLEEALAQLDPVDSQILRMKYYDGMTYQEIARQLGLTVGTVKMRSLRSRKKLFKILIIVLILALLAACAVAVLRKYQFSERGGFMWSEDMPMYEMVAGGYTWNTEKIQCTLYDAVFVPEDNGLVGTLHLYLSAVWQGEELDYANQDTYMLLSMELTPFMYMVNVEPFPSNSPESHDWLIRRERMDYELRFSWSMESKGQEKITIPIYYDGQWITDIVLEVAETVEYEMSDDSIELFNGTHWSKGPALVGDQYTVLSLFGVKGEGCYPTTSFYASQYRVPFQHGKSSSLIAEDGTEYPMMRASYRQNELVEYGQVSHFDLYFPVVPRGEYTLYIPTICYRREWSSQQFTLSLPETETLMVRPPCSRMALVSISQVFREQCMSTYSITNIWAAMN